MQTTDSLKSANKSRSVYHELSPQVRLTQHKNKASNKNVVLEKCKEKLYSEYSTHPSDVPPEEFNLTGCNTCEKVVQNLCVTKLSGRNY